MLPEHSAPRDQTPKDQTPLELTNLTPVPLVRLVVEREALRVVGVRLDRIPVSKANR